MTQPPCLHRQHILRASLPWALAVLTMVTLSATAFSQAVPAPSERLEELHFQLGDWKTTTRILGQDGKVVSERAGSQHTTLEHGGLLILSLSYSEGTDDPVQRRWQYLDQYKKRLFDVTFDMVGHFERRREQWNGDRLTFSFPEPESFQDGVFRNWRKTYYDIKPDSYRVIWDHSEDGKNWTEQIEILYRKEG